MYNMFKAIYIRRKTVYTFIFVDDDEMSRENFSYIANWGEIGFRFERAFPSAEETLEYLKSTKVDVILTDIQMAELSGLDLAHKVMVNYPETLVILISAYEKFEYAVTALRTNVFDYLTKPFLYSDIINVFCKAKKHLDLRSQGNEDVKIPYSLKTALDFMNERIGENITRKDVAEHIFMNPDYFSKWFKRNTGENFVSYYNRIKIQKAAELMCTTTMKIYEISSAVGYKSMHHFLSLFKQIMKATPNEYKSVTGHSNKEHTIL